MRIIRNNEVNTEAYEYMNTVPGAVPTIASLAVRTRAALMSGLPAQDVLAAATYIYQNTILPSGALARAAELSLPDEIVEPLLRAGMGYDPQPIDTSHVVMTEPMNAAVEAAARRIHESNSPMLRPWEDLTEEERRPSYAAAAAAVKTLAAIGGTSAAALDLKSSRESLAGALDKNTHDAWAKEKLADGARYGLEQKQNAQGRDVTHPDLLPFEDLSENTKSHEHRINVAVLDAIREEGLTVAPQRSLSAMADLLKKKDEKAVGQRQEAFEEEMEEQPQRKTSSDSEQIVKIKTELAKMSLREDVEKTRFVTSPYLLPGTDWAFDAATRMKPFGRDRLVPGVGIIEAGTSMRKDADTPHIVKPTIDVLTFDGGKKTFPVGTLTGHRDVISDTESAVLQACADEAERQGLHTRYDLEPVEQGKPCALDTISEYSRQNYLAAADVIVALLEKEGFKFDYPISRTSSQNDPAGVWPRTSESYRFFEAAKKAYPNFANVFDTLHSHTNVNFFYDGTEQPLKDEFLKARASAIRSLHSLDDVRAARMLANYILHPAWVAVDSWDGQLSPTKEQRARNAVSAFLDFDKGLSDASSSANVLLSVVSMNKDPQMVTTEVRRAVKMFLTGCSYAQTDPALEIRQGNADKDIREAVSKIEDWQRAYDAYEALPALSRLFRREPEFPAQAEATISTRVETLINAVNEAVEVERIMLPLSEDGHVLPQDGYLNRMADNVDAIVNFARTRGVSVPGELLERFDAAVTRARSLYPEKKGNIAMTPVDGFGQLLLDYGVDKDTVAKMKTAWLAGEHYEFSGEMRVRPAKSYDPEPPTRKVSVGIGIDEKGSLMLYHPATGVEIGSFRTFIPMRGFNLDLTESRAKNSDKKVSLKEAEKSVPEIKR